MEPIREFKGEYRWLSNFWPCQISFDGIPFPSVEHAYQAAKTLDFARRWEISNLKTAGDAKRAGRSLVMRPNWDVVKLPIMGELLRQKFFRNPDLAMRLLDTVGRLLVEGNTWGDTYWGVCNGKGTNHLGQLLMRVRVELMEVQRVR